jgi:competence protein ComEC
VVDAAAMTTAATLATAPLIAFHFGEISTVTLAANLLALPAVAPAMWLGMLVAAGGQVPGFPVEALNALEALLLGYVAAIAELCGRPAWASVRIHLDAIGLVASYAALGAVTAFLPHVFRRRRIAARRRRLATGGRRRAVAGIGAGLAALALFLGSGGRPEPEAPPAGLRITVLDVGQGDAILLQPARAPSILVDGGPPGDRLAGMLRERGVGALAAAIVTHDQSDHAGGIGELLGEMPVGRLLFAVADRRLLGEAQAAGARPTRIAAGGELRSGRLRLEVLWPPPALLAEPPAGEDPNRLALVMVARWGRFSMLLTSDAEAESTPIEPGPVDVLKVSHHGSEDAGLDRLLDRSAPRLAVISVGEDNPYGHPTAATVAALAAHGTRVMRTDRDGSVVLEVRAGAVEVHRGG